MLSITYVEMWPAKCYSSVTHCPIHSSCNQCWLRMIFLVTSLFLSHLSLGTLEALYRIYPKDLDTLSSYHTCPKIWNIPFYYLLMCLKYCCMYVKQWRHWSDAAFCGVWSGSTLFAKANVPILRVITVSRIDGFFCFFSRQLGLAFHAKCLLRQFI